MDLLGDFNPSEKYEFVNWDDELPNIYIYICIYIYIYGKIKHVPNHQPVIVYQRVNHP